MNLHWTLFLTAVALALSACGGGGSSTPSGAPSGTQSIGGIWQGTFTTASGASIEGSAVIGENGSLYSDVEDPATFCANLMAGSLTVSGSGVSGSVTVSLVSTLTSNQRPCTFPDGSTSGTGTVTGSVSERASLVLNPKIITAKGTTLSSNALSLVFNASLYDQSASLAKIAGTYSGSAGVVTVISSTGALTVENPNGCQVMGQVAPIDASYNAYSASGSYQGCSGSAATMNGATVSGVLTLVTNVSPAALFGGYLLSASGGSAVTLSEGTILRPPTKLSYAGSTTLVLGMPASLSPSITGSANVWSVSPALPSGLSLDPTSGVLGGTPQALSPPTTYSVTAKNAAGSVSATVQLTVQEIQANLVQAGATGQVLAEVNAFSEFGISQVSATIDGQSLGTLKTPNGCTAPGSPPVCNSNWYVFALDATALGSGSHTLVVQVTDGNGAVDTASKQVLINNPPILTFTPADGAIVYGSLSFSGTAASDKAGVGITTTAKFDGANLLTTTAGSFSTTYNVASLPPGNYPLVVTSTDATGASSSVTATITVASAAALVYTPIATLGAGATLLAVDPTSFAYSTSTSNGVTSTNNYYLQTGSNPVTLQGIPSSFGTATWIISDGVAFASGNAGDRPGTNDSVYGWSASGAISNLSTLAKSVGIGDQLYAARGGWVLWASTTVNVGQSVFELYNPSTAQRFSIPTPPSATYLYQGDVYVSASGPAVYFSAQAASQSPLYTGNVYQWTANGGTKLVYSGGENTGVQTDGVRVAWQTTAAGTSCPQQQQLCALTVLDIASSSIQQVTQDLVYPDFFLADGVLAWSESSAGTVGGVRGSPGTGAVTQTPSASVQAELYGTGGGYVLFLNTDRKLYVWNTSTNSAELLFDAAPTVAKISGKSVYFTNGATQALYRVALP